ncbi:MAG: hypothetical protein ABIH23_26865 [bacterium]
MSEVDQIIEEIRRSRCRMSEECDHDLRRYIDLLKEYNRKYSAQVERYHKLRPVADQVQTPEE